VVVVNSTLVVSSSVPAFASCLTIVFFVACIGSLSLGGCFAALVVLVVLSERMLCRSAYAWTDALPSLDGWMFCCPLPGRMLCRQDLLVGGCFATTVMLRRMLCRLGRVAWVDALPPSLCFGGCFAASVVLLGWMLCHLCC
jgi:hypothetical protein